MILFEFKVVTHSLFKIYMLTFWNLDLSIISSLKQKGKNVETNLVYDVRVSHKFAQVKIEQTCEHVVKSTNRPINSVKSTTQR